MVDLLLIFHQWEVKNVLKATLVTWYLKEGLSSIHEVSSMMTHHLDLDQIRIFNRLQLLLITLPRHLQVI